MQDEKPASGRYWLNRALFDLGDPKNRAAFETEPAAYVDGYPLDRPQRRAMLEADWPALLELGALPVLVFKYYMVRGLPPEKFSAFVKGKGHG